MPSHTAQVSEGFNYSDMAKGVYKRTTNRGWFKKGQIPWNIGKKNPLAKENPQVFREGHTPWNKNKKGEYHIFPNGREFSEEWIKNMKKNHKGMTGKKHSEETILKMRIKRSKQIFPTKNTKIERIMQDELKDKKIDFEKHAILLNKYRVDLFIKPNLVIECDGDYWHNLSGAQKRDRKRDFKLKEAGYNVLRFWEHEIKKSSKLCIDKVLKTLLKINK